jgi:hypothetical protein
MMPCFKFASLCFHPFPRAPAQLGATLCDIACVVSYHPTAIMQLRQHTQRRLCVRGADDPLQRGGPVRLTDKPHASVLPASVSGACSLVLVEVYNR